MNTAKLAPGDWKGAVLLRSLDTSPIEIRVPLAITVWKAHLPAKQVLRNCGWGYVESSVLKDVPDAALRDQVDHGANVFVATYYPKAKFDASGALVGDIDFAEHDTYVKRHAPHGIILFCGYQGALTGPAEATPEAARKAHVQWLRLWVKHLADLGVGYDGFALYPVDEPGLHDGLVDEYLRLAKLAREADPKIQMYTDPVGGITIEQLKSMTPYVDIWCPNRGGLILGKDCAEKLALILATGKPVWTYECDDNAKHQTPLGYYRGQAWLAWSHGISGIGFWSYCTSPDDPWFAPKSRYDYLLIYPGNGVVDSKRWEAVRDGIEDYAMLDELRKTVERTSATAKPEDIAAAKRVLGERASGIGQYCVLRDEKTPAQIPGLDAMALSARTEDRHWAEVQAVRQEIARLLEAL